MNIEFKINQKVICFGKKCIIIATKTEPFLPKIDPFNRANLFPEKDYLLFILKTLEPTVFEGILDVLENQIENKEW